MIIGITGPFCDNNFGDYTMLLNDIYDFTDAGAALDKVVIFCYETELVGTLCKDYFSEYNTEIIQIKTNIGKAEQNAFMGVDHTEDCPTPIEILRTIENIDEVREKISQLDLVVSCGGGHFDYYWLGLKRRYRLFSILTPCIVARQMNKKVVMLGHSFGPWGKNKEFFSGIFNYINFDSIDCRDNLYSKKYLNAISVTENIHEVCDDLAIINPKISNRSTDVNLTDYYILDIYASIQDIEHNISTILSFVSTMKERNLKPVFVAHGPEYNGTRQAQLLKKYIPDLEIFKSKADYLKPEDFIALIKGAAFVLCEHYHSFVLSTTHKVPAIMLVRKIDGSHYYYYNKTVGFLKISQLLEKSKCGEELFCTLNLPELFDSKKNEGRINNIKLILDNIEFTQGQKKMNYMKRILNLAKGGQ